MSGMITHFEATMLMRQHGRQQWLYATWRRWYATMLQPVYALPIDCFRILVGLLSSAYFVRLWMEVPDISSPEGLLDHELLQQIFWYTRLSLFQPGMQAWHFSLIFLVAALVSWLLVLGWRPKLAALFLYLVAVSTFRWNFLVAYLDDGIMHLFLGWLVLLPIGQTVTLRDWLCEGPTAWERWKRTTVPGLAVYGFLANLALIYVAAGLWKWTSPMWLDGTAVYAALKMPISIAPAFWRPEHLTGLRIANYGALIVEPLLALMVILPRNHFLKWTLIASAFALHSGIALTLRIPYANLACLCGLVIVVRDEIMAGLRQGGAAVQCFRPVVRQQWLGKLSLLLVTLLTLAMLGDALPNWRQPSGLSRKEGRNGSTLPPGEILFSIRSSTESGNWLGDVTHGNPMHVPLWLVGLAQNYRLLDWIDDVNYTATYEIQTEGNTPVREVSGDQTLFPTSPRGAALQAYMTDIRWIIVPPSWSDVLKQSLFERVARRYCQRNSPIGQVEVFITVERVTTSNPDLNQGRRERLMTFECANDEAHMLYMPTEQEPGSTQ